MKRVFNWFLFIGLLAGTFTVTRADSLDNWTTNQINIDNPYGAHGTKLGGVAYGNGRYVAAGEYLGDDYGFVETSDDGVNWMLHTHFAIDSIWDLFDVAYGNGTFVAVGWDAYTGNNLLSSTDGTNWTPHSSKIANFYRVIYGGNLFVAVGDGWTTMGISATNRNIYTSPDGTNWTARNSGAPVTEVYSINDIAYGAGRFVAVDNSGYSYTSSFGTSWTRNTVGNFSHINFCNDRFIVRAGGNTNLVSSDGLSWSGMVKDTTNVFSRVIFKNGLYAAFSDSALFTSTNATNWIKRNFQVATNVYLFGLVFGQTNLALVGYQWDDGSLLGYAKTFVSDTFLSINLAPAYPPQLKISGVRGWPYRIDYLDNLSAANNWQTLATFSLTNSPYLLPDTTVIQPQRFYRAVLFP